MYEKSNHSYFSKIFLILNCHKCCVSNHQYKRYICEGQMALVMLYDVRHMTIITSDQYNTVTTWYGHLWTHDTIVMVTDQHMCFISNSCQAVKILLQMSRWSLSLLDICKLKLYSHVDPQLAL